LGGKKGGQRAGERGKVLLKPKKKKRIPPESQKKKENKKVKEKPLRGKENGEKLNKGHGESKCEKTSKNEKKNPIFKGKSSWGSCLDRTLRVLLFQDRNIEREREVAQMGPCTQKMPRKVGGKGPRAKREKKGHVPIWKGGKEGLKG